MIELLAIEFLGPNLTFIMGVLVFALGIVSILLFFFKGIKELDNRG